MNLQPNLEGKLSVVRPLQSTDFESLYVVACDPLLWEQHPNPDRWQKTVFQTFFEGAIASQGAFLISDRMTGEVIGSSRFYGYDAEKSLVYIGYTFFGRNYWGKGVNTEVKKRMLAHAFQWVDRVHFQIGATNFRSQIAIERLGAKKIGEELVAYVGEPEKMNFIYEITQSTWSGV